MGFDVQTTQEGFRVTKMPLTADMSRWYGLEV